VTHLLSKKKAHKMLDQQPRMGALRLSCCDFYVEVDISRPRIYEPVRGRWGIHTKELPMIRVELKNLVATQKYLRPESIHWHIDNPPPERTPIVFKFRGKLYVHNGHHRFVMRKIRGIKSAMTRFADLDTMTQLAIVPKRFPREEKREASNVQSSAVVTRGA